MSAGMLCCFTHSLLRDAERDAIARLREQRAQGCAPGASTHCPVVEHFDPVFFSHPLILPHLNVAAALLVLAGLHFQPHRDLHSSRH